ncbi:hypothetical protein VF14_13740 [Nostoc linckia z18]|uniref:Uncharacterized protein n=2 Tax=Nostoc linckia TaxID=92942 RepID=A0A9Q6ELC2_NOSLI|nr:hypothetical protein [Nostoc linckia]PHK42228.1 hypothetical protein VF12_03420 [Nostoc linckia z15]PHK45435.1 hypothetical protein VF13_15875 [Nostoc linckia z16]PHJ59012.1 hypothetical protein VF02_25855 [Nostoc linckia z1]PHJ61865.1 hypothetical protein VF05_27555 [Nostoc linckia z3]PHJ67782.1 hypothetical protein VF03_25305 [Nostoc linckia z2]
MKQGRPPKPMYVVVDHEDRIFGRWIGRSHYVLLHYTTKEAKQTIIEQRLPLAKVGIANAFTVNLAPSRFSL